MLAERATPAGRSEHRSRRASPQDDAEEWSQDHAMFSQRGAASHAAHFRISARQARSLAKFDRAPERNILGDLSTGAQGKHSQRTRSAGVAA